MLENVRYETGETKNDPELAQRYADAGRRLRQRRVRRRPPRPRLHRGASRACCRARPAGLLEREVSTLRGILDDPKRPLVAVVGGAKVTDKIGVLEAFLDRADTILIGGAMCFPFFKAQGHDIGDSLCEEAGVEPAREAGRRGRQARAAPRTWSPAASSRPTRERRELDGDRRARTAGWASTSARTRPSATPA